MTRRLADKTALVVGAGSVSDGWGNGRAIATLFARHGAKVFCVDRDATAAATTVERIAAEGGIAHAHVADVGRAEEIDVMVAMAAATLGRIDILVNNVGIAEVGGIIETDEQAWDRIFAVNLKSCALTMRRVVPMMRDQGGGSIVNISSIASIRHLGVPYVTYAATKAAMNQITLTTAVQHAPDRVRVNALLPGLMKTPMVEKSTSLAARYGDGDVEDMWRRRDAQCPMGFMGDAWDVAHAALFLASDESRYVTGLELVVDGGLTLKVT